MRLNYQRFAQRIDLELRQPSAADGSRWHNSKMVRKATLFVVGVLLLVLSAYGQTGAKVDKTRKHIMELNEAWASAINKGDAQALETLFADDIVVTAGNGQVRTKAAEIKDAAGAPDPDFSWTRPFATDDVRVQVYGDAAVVTGHVSWAFKYKGRASSNDRRYTHVYVRRNGRWQIVAQQISSNIASH